MSEFRHADGTACKHGLPGADYYYGTPWEGYDHCPGPAWEVIREGGPAAGGQGSSATVTSGGGAGTWQCPPGVNSVQVWASGGAGGSSSLGGGGGGSVTIVPGHPYTVSLNTGGGAWAASGPDFRTVVSSGGYASGGNISYAGKDSIPAMLTAGEVIAKATFSAPLSTEEFNKAVTSVNAAIQAICGIPPAQAP